MTEKVLKLSPSINLVRYHAVIDNCRPISTLPVLSKILERIVYKQLVLHRESNSLLLAITYFTNCIRREANRGNLTGAVYIDLSKALNTSSHSCLLNKLPSYCICDVELEWFADYLFSVSNL